ncbi:Uma2 family endonuclease [Thermostichus vulcanus]|uniref:Uma2 family endonuclease n=1 Tax=Thermostichus vulcanus str. 'Rupite' TaxID=2813851 RepID=A0ABT0C7B0_THEVL|nr:Uma2 family endonuclease [Thermostichus vulcanus]MCJ2541602.1 Uma2 family endonuclease [Thermostichus vulcanus str. 'Rupite']
MLVQDKSTHPNSLTRQQLAELMPSAQGLLSDEPEMEHSLHALQLLILVTCLHRLWQDRSDYFLAWNLTVYYSREQLKTKDFRGPDLFLVKGVSNHPRGSWVVWEEGGKYPDLIIELLSESTAEVDRTEKRELYQTIFRTPEYFYFSPETLEFMGLRLQEGLRYEEIPATEQGWRWSEVLGLYLGIHNRQLRYFLPTGELALLPEEAERLERQRAEQERQRAEQERQRAEQERQRAEQERQRAEQERQRTEQERQRAERLAQKLRELGVDPASLEK